MFPVAVVLSPMNILLWIAQALLALTLLYGGVMKAFVSVDALSAEWPWTAELPTALVRGLGVIDLLGAAGLVLPMLTGIRPRLTVMAAWCTAALMLCAATFHLVRGEGSQIGINVFCAALAVLIARGRAR